MSAEIKTISLFLPYRLGNVNCFLIETDIGYILIDTGCSNNRNDLEKYLESMGCKPGYLKLIFLTHGDFDHTGNAAFLRRKFDTKIAMHKYDSGMLEYGDMFWNRKKPFILDGNLFCGDLLENKDKPVLNSIIDDSGEANTSVEKLKGLEINTVYPGHGKPFPRELFIKIIDNRGIK